MARQKQEWDTHTISWNLGRGQTENSQSLQIKNMTRFHCRSIPSEQAVLNLATKLCLSHFVHADLFSMICLLSNSLLTQTSPARQTFAFPDLISRNSLAMTKPSISHAGNTSPISLQLPLHLCRSFPLQASISCNKNSDEEQITLHAWCWFWHLVTKESC